VHWNENSKIKEGTCFRKTEDYCAVQPDLVTPCAWDNLSLLHYKFTVRSCGVGGRRKAVFACFASLLHCSRISPVPTLPTVLPVNKDRLPQSTRTLLAQALVATSGRIFPLPPETGPAFTMLATEPRKMRRSFAVLVELLYYWPLQTSLCASIEQSNCMWHRITHVYLQVAMISTYIVHLRCGHGCSARTI
jgi:hypothetical protein